jgi:predicted ATPase with chaperone activity
LLILDEFHELNRDCRELLRTVLDQKKIMKHTRDESIDWPAEFWLILTANPCECGYAEGPDLSNCHCLRHILKTYQARLSGPLLDRMGIRRFVKVEDEFATPIDLEFFQRPLKFDAVKTRRKIKEWMTAFRSRGIEGSDSDLRTRKKKLRAAMALAIEVTELYSADETEELLRERDFHEKFYFEASTL